MELGLALHCKKREGNIVLACFSFFHSPKPAPSGSGRSLCTPTHGGSVLCFFLLFVTQSQALKATGAAQRDTLVCSSCFVCFFFFFAVQNQIHMTSSTSQSGICHTVTYLNCLVLPHHHHHLIFLPHEASPMQPNSQTRPIINRSKKMMTKVS